MVVQRPPGFIEPCLPSKVTRPPSGPLWVHEIKHDGYRLMVRRDGARVRSFTRNGHDWADRFPAIVAAARPLQILIGLLISNGPGSITAQGAKGAVAADGPQTSSRVQINKAMVGFLTHSGYSHGGNGFGGMAFLLEQFKDVVLKDPTDSDHGLDLKSMATKFAETYKEEKSQSKEAGFEGPRALPGVHHPIFKGKPVNYDPRERFIAGFMEKRGDYNVFHAFYRELVQALYETGASRYVFCVNVDAVIAALLLAILWKDYRSGALTEKDLETAAFNVFLYGRMIGAAAEIDDHLNRGRNMDTRTPQEQCAFVV